MGYGNMVHYWHSKKEIGSLVAFVNFGGLLGFPSKSRQSQISVADTHIKFVSDPKISGGHKIGLIAARDLILFSQMSQMQKRFDFNGCCTNLMPTSMPKS